MYNGEVEFDATARNGGTRREGSHATSPSMKRCDETLAFPGKRLAERDLLRVLRDVTNALASNLDLPDLVRALSSALRPAIPHAFAALALHEPGSDALVLHAAAFRSAEGHQNGHHHQGTRLPLTHSPSGRALSARRPLVFNDDELTEFAEVVAPLRQEGIRALCCVPLVVRDVALGTLEVGSLEPDGFAPDAVAVIDAVARQVAMAFPNTLAFKQIAQLRHKRAGRPLDLESESPTGHTFREIIGNSRSLREALRQVEVVARTDSTVLVLGETGTGKELIARAIHARSDRRERTFVKINCAAIPSGLLESELFGHERGAFTGAVTQKIGRFEAANGGTLFLDEVGDIPPEIQPKLLRVLQEQEFERLGGTRTIKVNVRLVAATNRDLARMVEERSFRDDLYYRLNVFPICVPPLRERPEDIEALVRHFVAHFARRMQRRIDVIPTEILEAMHRYPWPGNVRELENLIERAVILSSGRRLAVPLEQLTHRRSSAAPDGSESTLESVERAHVVRMLEESDWVIGGHRGAAVRLGMKRTTLQSLMKRHAIARPL
jgi:formate hydrogenlyase transcriptional activator